MKGENGWMADKLICVLVSEGLNHSVAGRYKVLVIIV